jgi:hypothetical protein
VPTIGRVQSQIKGVERFDVKFTDPRSGRDVPDHKQDVPGYPYDIAAPEGWTVAEWKAKRFNEHYSGYGCDVLDASGRAAHGGRLLNNVRDTY